VPIRAWRAAVLAIESHPLDVTYVKSRVAQGLGYLGLGLRPNKKKAPNIINPNLIFILYIHNFNK
jgi:hypothetical protein